MEGMKLEMKRIYEIREQEEPEEEEKEMEQRCVDSHKCRNKYVNDERREEGKQ